MDKTTKAINFSTLLLLGERQRYTYRVLLCVWAEPAVLGSTKSALKFKYEI